MHAVSYLLSQSILVYRKNFNILIGYSSWILVPYAAIILLDFLPESLPVQLLAFLTLFVQLFLFVWVFIILSVFLKATLTGEPIDPHRLPEKTKELILPVLSISILQILLMLGGLLLLIIPFFLFLVWFSMSQFVVIFEQKRGLEALTSSRTLTNGRFWPVALRAAVIPCGINLLFSFVIALLITTVSAIQGINPVQLLRTDIPLWADILENIGQAFLMPFILVYLMHIYINLSTSTANKLL